MAEPPRRQSKRAPKRKPKAASTKASGTATSAKSTRNSRSLSGTTNQSARRANPQRPNWGAARATLAAKLRRAIWFLGVRFALIAVLAGGALVAWLDLTVRAQFEGHRWALPAQIYARPLTLYPGLQIAPKVVITELQAVGYRAADNPQRAGQFAVSTAQATVYTRDFKFWDGQERGARLHVTWRGDQIATIADDRGKTLDLARLEPALIGKIYPADKQDRRLKPLLEYPPELVAGLVMVEDRDFFEHNGVSLWGVARAMFANLRAGAAVQGGSTLTQQLAKNFFLTHERTLWRKLREGIIAMLLEYHYDKETILEAYMNEIHLGQHGARAIHGFGSAAEFFFARPVQELELHESALLLALVRGGSFYNPRRRPERALKRRDLVLKIMSEQGVVTTAVASAAQAKPLGIREQATPTASRHPAFMELVRAELRKQYSESTLRREGLRVFTTLEPATQQAAEQALEQRLDNLELTKRLPRKSLQGAVVVVAPSSGDVLAVVGGRDVRRHGFNRALHARRPIGSMVKPVVFLTALEQGRYHNDSVLRDDPISVRLSGSKTWRPRNYDGRSHGAVTFDQALAKSLNLATVRLGLDIGVPEVVKTLKKLGVEQSIKPAPSLLLGSIELSPLQLAQLYQPLASQGFMAPLRAVREVTDNDGRTLERFELDFSEGAKPSAVRKLRRAMMAVVRNGTARYAHQQLNGVNVAGKTGTTDGLRDSWFGGFDRDRLAIIWVGRDDNKPAGLTGASGALRIWTDVMIAVGAHDLTRPASAHTGAVADAPRPSVSQPARVESPAPAITPSPVAARDCTGDVLGSWLQNVFGTDCNNDNDSGFSHGQETGGGDQ